MSAERLTYLDSSAIVKLVVREPESASLRRFLRGRRPLVSSGLARVEVERACLGLGDPIRKRAADVLRRLDLVRVNERVLAAAGSLLPVELRSLDAIHLATAALLGTSLETLVTYDVRMAGAARACGFAVTTPK